MRNVNALARATIIIFSSVGLQAAATAAESLMPAGIITITYDLGDHRVPVWSYGALAIFSTYEMATPVVHLVGADGRELTPTAFSIPDAGRMLLHGAVHTNDGRIAVCGVAYSRSGSGGGFVAWFAPGSSDATVVRTGLYTPYLITAARDGTIWTEGFEMVNGVETNPAVNPANGIVRGFDRSGKMIHSLVPRNSLQEKAGPLSSGWMASSKDGIGWYLGRVNAYIELGFDGALHRYAGVPDLEDGYVNSLAMSESGRVFVSGTTRTPQAPHLYVLDKEHGVWKDVAIASQHTPPVIYGTEGEKLVTMGETRFNIAFFDVQ